jgi:hypothetical protein
LHGSQRHTFDGSFDLHIPGGFAFFAPGAGFNALAALSLPTPEAREDVSRNFKAGAEGFGCVFF